MHEYQITITKEPTVDHLGWQLETFSFSESDITGFLRNSSRRLYVRKLRYIGLDGRESIRMGTDFDLNNTSYVIRPYSPLRTQFWIVRHQDGQPDQEFDTHAGAFAYAAEPGHGNTVLEIIEAVGFRELPTCTEIPKKEEA